MNNLETTSQKELITQLQHCVLSIRYSPLPDELDPDQIPFLPPINEIIHLTTNKSSSPEMTAEELRARYKDQNAYLLTPGTRFDWNGTRHGRGGGWYDRFLSKIPSYWTRIGVMQREQIADEPLKREVWDEPMDWLIYFDQNTWQVKRSLISRDAR